MVGGSGAGLARISTFSGGITNSGAIVGVTGIVVNGAVLTFNGAISNSGTISGTGGTAIDVSTANNGIAINQGGGLIAGNILLSAHSDTLNVGGGSIAGNIVGQGNGTVNFALGAGTFVYSNTIANVQAVDVKSGTLFDSGAITAAGVVVASGGTLAPGAPGVAGGTLSISGTAEFCRRRGLPRHHHRSERERGLGQRCGYSRRRHGRDLAVQRGADRHAVHDPDRYRAAGWASAATRFLRPSVTSI